MNGPTAEAFLSAVRTAIGYAPERIEPGRWQRFSTGGRPGDQAGWCKLFDDLDGGVFGCYRQNLKGHWTARHVAAMTRQARVEWEKKAHAAARERDAHQRRQWARNARRNAALWEQCLPLTEGDAAMRYLASRGLDGCLPLPDCLRLHPGLPYWHGPRRLGTFPALVAPLLTYVGAAGNDHVPYVGRIHALHRTYVTHDGKKADVPGPKKVTAAAGPLAGACVPLYAPASGCIGIAEGIETALAARCASGLPTVAAYCASNLAAWHWPPGLQRLVIFADADKAGREAADTLRVRALAAGLRVELLTPTTEGADWCDVWTAQGRLAGLPGGTP